MTWRNLDVTDHRSETSSLRCGPAVGGSREYWVATRAPYRGRGLGEAVTRVVSNAGFDLGARLIALRAGGKPETLYRRVGYIPVTRFRWWGMTGLG